MPGQDGRVSGGDDVQPEEFFGDQPAVLAVFERVRAIIDRLGPFTVRTTKSQVTFRRKRGFAYLWRPGQYLKNPRADVVLSIALGRHDKSTRFKEVAHPAPTQWMHHLEVHDIGDVDEEVADWLREAAERAS